MVKFRPIFEKRREMTQSAKKRSGRGFQTPRNGLGGFKTPRDSLGEASKRPETDSERFKMIRFGLGPQEGARAVPAGASGFRVCPL